MDTGATRAYLGHAGERPQAGTNANSAPAPVPANGYCPGGRPESGPLVRGRGKPRPHRASHGGPRTAPRWAVVGVATAKE
eukprot:8479978-Lingulodinium_polyedra.AAC.1